MSEAYLEGMKTSIPPLYMRTHAQSEAYLEGMKTCFFDAHVLIVFVVRSLPRRNENVTHSGVTSCTYISSEAYLEGMKTSTLLRNDLLHSVGPKPTSKE